jgi:ribosome-associated protein
VKKEPTASRWTSLDLALRIADLLDEKQAQATVVLEVTAAVQVTDYFVIAGGQNRRHINVLAEHVARELKKDGVYRMGGTDLHDEQWVLLDFGPVVLHVFAPEAREFYDLENLWGDCRRVPRGDSEPAEPPA